MNDIAQKRTIADTLAAAITLAMLFAYLEVLKAHRSDLWVGAGSAEWLGALAGLLIYTFVIFALSYMFGRLLTPKTALGPLFTFVAACALWAALSAFREHTPTLDDALVAAALIAYTLSLMFFHITGYMSRPAFYWVCANAFAAGISAVVATTDRFFLNTNRAAIVTVTSAAWLALCALIGILVFIGQRKTQRKTCSFVCPALFIILPLVMYVVPQFSDKPNAKENGPSAILIVADTMRADYTSVYGGHVPTPNLEELAKEGVLFKRSHSLAPWTLPSMTGIFASSYPPGLTPGASKEQWLYEVNYYKVDTERSTFAEQLSEQGLATGAFVANPVLGHLKTKGIKRGFQECRIFHHFVRPRTSLFKMFPFFQDMLASLYPPLVETRRPLDTSRLATEYARQFLRKYKDTSFFLWLHFMDPHDPYDPPERLRTEEGPWPLFCQSNPYWGTPQMEPDGDITLTDSEKAYAQSLYEGEIRYVDECVGIIRKELQSLGIADKTNICFTADHGEEFWDHGKCNHTHSLYQELINVPLIFAGPGVNPGSVNMPVSAIDLIPTLAELIKAEKDPLWRGQSLGNVLVDRDSLITARPCFAQATHYTYTKEPLQMVAKDNFKLIRGTESGECELYDIVQDPKEQNNLADEHPEIVQDMTKLLLDWSASFPSTFSELYANESPPEISEAEIERLRSIGYLP